MRRGGWSVMASRTTGAVGREADGATSIEVGLRLELRLDLGCGRSCASSEPEPDFCLRCPCAARLVTGSAAAARTRTRAREHPRPLYGSGGGCVGPNQSLQLFLMAAMVAHSVSHTMAQCGSEAN